MLDQRGQQRRLLTLVHPVRRQPGGKEDQQHARRAEKGAHIQPLARGENQPAQDHGNCQPQRTAEYSLRGSRAEGSGREKEHCLDPLPHHGPECQAEQSPRAANGYGPAHIRLQFRLNLPALALHPKDHPGQHSCGQ